jgi:MFS family permease
MNAFWILILSLMIGLVLGGWFVAHVIPNSLGALIVGLVHALIVGLVVILFLCYRAYKSELLEQSNQRPIPNQLTRVKHELIAAIPLFLGALAEFYFIVVGKFTHIIVIGFLSLLFWVALRIFLSRTRRRQTP